MDQIKAEKAVKSRTIGEMEPSTGSKHIGLTVLSVGQCKDSTIDKQRARTLNDMMLYGLPTSTETLDSDVEDEM